MRWAGAGLLLLLLLLQTRLWTGDGSIPVAIGLHAEVAEQRQANQQLDERNRALAADVADLRRGQGSIEERARRDLGLFGPEERFYLEIDEDAR